MSAPLNEFDGGSEIFERENLRNRRVEIAQLRDANERLEIFAASRRGGEKAGSMPDGLKQIQLRDGIGNKADQVNDAAQLRSRYRCCQCLPARDVEGDVGTVTACGLAHLFRPMR
jgi:hypothetical protein